MIRKCSKYKQYFSKVGFDDFRIFEIFVKVYLKYRNEHLKMAAGIPDIRTNTLQTH